MKEWEDIKVNRRKNDKVYFESPIIQSVSDRIDLLRKDSKVILEKLDSNEFKRQIDEFDLEEFGKNIIDQIDDVSEEFSKVKSEFVNSDDFPEFLKESSKNAKMALNRDEIYIRRAKRKLDKINSSDELVSNYKANIRVIELCDKAIDIDGSNYEAFFLKGLALINIGKYDEAIEELISSLALNEDNLDARLNIAHANRLNGDYDDAISVYDSVLERDENSFEAFKGKAFTYFECEDFTKADGCFKKANSIRPLDSKSKDIWDKCSN